MFISLISTKGDKIKGNEPGKRKNHPATGCHDADGGKHKAYERQPELDIN